MGDMINTKEKIKKQEMIENLVIPIPTLTVDHVGEDAQNLFTTTPELEGIVVLDNKKPSGLIMRSYFYQKIGTQYGQSLYFSRNLPILMDTTVLVVDTAQSISEVVTLAMERDFDRLYDFVVVTHEDDYVGVINIKMFLTELTRSREQHLTSIKNLLDNAGQGFLSFNNDLSIREDYSAECLNIFNKEIGNLCFTRLMSEYLTDTQSVNLARITQSYFKNLSPQMDEAYLSLLPKECVIHKKNIRLDYTSIYNSVEKMLMVVLTDITSQKNLEKQMEEERYRQHLIIKGATYQMQIKQLLEELNAFISYGYKEYIPAEGICNSGTKDIFRIIHTFKGDLSQYGFLRTAAKLHKIEDKLSELLNECRIITESLINIVFAGVVYEKLVESDIEILNNTFGINFFKASNYMKIPIDRINLLIGKAESMSGSAKNDQFLELFKELKLTNMADHLRQFKDSLSYQADRLGKPTPTFTVEADDILVDMDKYHKLFKSFIHLFRNMIDHGIESEDVRTMIDKSPVGNIHATLRERDGYIHLSLKDDGRGIDINKVMKKALTCNIATKEELDAMSEEEVINIIFLDCFSTKNETSLQSGRGIGMAAVRQECEKLGGTIRLRTVQFEGTEYIIDIPKL